MGLGQVRSISIDGSRTRAFFGRRVDVVARTWSLVSKHINHGAGLTAAPRLIQSCLPLQSVLQNPGARADGARNGSSASPETKGPAMHRERCVRRNTHCMRTLRATTISVGCERPAPFDGWTWKRSNPKCSLCLCVEGWQTVGGSVEREREDCSLCTEVKIVVSFERFFFLLLETFVCYFDIFSVNLLWFLAPVIK